MVDMMSMNRFKQPISEVVDSLDTDLERGLASEDARRRLAEHGANELLEAKQASPLMLFLQQFKNSLLIILLIAPPVG